MGGLEFYRADRSMTEDFVIKYFWSACGYSLMSIPILFPAVKTQGQEVASRTESESSVTKLIQAMYQIEGCCSRWQTRGDA